MSGPDIAVAPTAERVRNEAQDYDGFIAGIQQRLAAMRG